MLRNVVFFSSQLIELDPSLYPVLMVLGRLFPSSLEGTDTNLNLAAFIPYIIKYVVFKLVNVNCCVILANIPKNNC